MTNLHLPVKITFSYRGEVITVDGVIVDLIKIGTALEIIVEVINTDESYAINVANVIKVV